MEAMKTRYLPNLQASRKHCPHWAGFGGAFQIIASIRPVPEIS